MSKSVDHWVFGEGEGKFVNVDMDVDKVSLISLFDLPQSNSTQSNPINSIK